MDGLHDHLARYRDSFLSTDHGQVSVNDMWVSFKSEVLSAIERFIPSKMTKTKYSLPWIDSSIKRLIRKRDKLYFRARKSSSPDIKNHYKRFRAHVQKSIRDAYWKHRSYFLFSLMIFLTTSGHLFGYLLMIVFYTEMSSHHWIVKFYKMT